MEGSDCVLLQGTDSHNICSEELSDLHEEQSFVSEVIRRLPSTPSQLT